MPGPLILIPVAMGLFGAGKTVQAYSDNSEADRLNSDAGYIVDKSEEKLDIFKRRSNAALEELGAKKLDGMTKTLPNFVAQFEKLKNVELTTNIGEDNLQITSELPTVEEIKNDCSLVNETITGLGAGITGGALVAFGAYNGTMLFAAASTGTAISSLSGAAATNATLAWLGGGSLASGGGGMTAGASVLGATVAGPALMIFGSILSAKANKNLSDAKSNLELAKTFANECDATTVKLDGIREISLLVSEVLSKSKSACRRATKKMAQIISESGTDFSQYTDEQKEHVFKTVKSAQLVKSIIEVPILDDDGAIMGDVNSKLSKLADFI